MQNWLRMKLGIEENDDHAKITLRNNGNDTTELKT